MYDKVPTKYFIAVGYCHALLTHCGVQNTQFLASAIIIPNGVVVHANHRQLQQVTMEGVFPLNGEDALSDIPLGFLERLFNVHLAHLVNQCVCVCVFSFWEFLFVAKVAII
jgi:hypothetical protein